ncbi:MAG: polyphosphate kinase 1, partial [Bacteroidota bacterium]
SDVLPRFQFVPGEDGSHHFVYLDDIVRDNVGLVFQGFNVLECKSVKLNKDADLHIDDEYSGDLVEKIQKQIQKRNLGTPSRFLYDKSMSMEMVNYFTMAFNLKESDLVAGGRYHNLSDYFQVFNPSTNDLEYEKLSPLRSSSLDAYQSILEAISDRDHLLHFPYQTYDYVLQFFSEAAIDPDVEEIYVTFYRMAKDSVIGEALISAANNGKKVIVFMEVKARFDEENNLLWSTRMKNAGIKIIYSIPGLKVHAKVALVRKKDKSFGFFGTGNLNEKTAKIYCDYGLLTCDEGMTSELLQVFKFLHKKKTPENFSDLIVSQFNAIPTFTSLIEREIAAAKKGQPARIVIKVNNLEEQDMIANLYQAAEAGVTVTVLARSICCLVPQTLGIKVVRLVDRYLEHARVFYFHNEGREEVYLGSSDWMKRNLHHRVEVSFPIKEQTLKDQIITIINLQLADNMNAVTLDEQMQNNPVPPAEPAVNAQLSTYHQVATWNSPEENQ